MYRISSIPILCWAYCALIIVGLMLPSDGNHGVTSPKSLAFLSTMGCFASQVLREQRYRLSTMKLFAFFLLSLSFLFTWYLWGSLSRETLGGSQFDQFKIFIITVATTIVTVHIIKQGLMKPQAIIRIAIYANFIYSFLKVFAGSLHILGIMNIFTFMSKTGLRFMTMDIASGIVRLQTSVDIVAPFLILFLLMSHRLGISFSLLFKIVYCFVSIIAIFLSFSRFLMAVAAMSFLLSWLTLSLPKLASRLSLMMAIVTAAVFIIGTDHVYTVIEKRFFSNDNYYSDKTRIDQIEALSSEFLCNPLLGKGLGSYAEDCIRDHVLKHSYEVQWMAFLMQFGILGISLLILPLTWIAARFLQPPWSREYWAFFGLFLIWILSGFTNPFLISLTSGIIYSLFYIVVDCFDNKDTQDNVNKISKIIY